jgi:hypothetical protein
VTIDKLKFRKLDASTGATRLQTLEPRGLSPGNAPAVILEGKAAPHADVVVENKSLAIFAPVNTADAFTHTKAGADGTFQVELPAAREGDRIRVQSRGGASAVNVRIANIESIDGRPPVVRQQGLRLVARADGAFGFAQVCRSETVGEPGQLLRMTNVRTKDAITFTLDDDGRLPKDARLTGNAGDSFELATSDGVHNTSFADGCGLLVAPSSGEPAAAARANRRLITLREPLFVDGGPSARAVKQGEIGDCWLVAAADAIATMKPSRLRDMMKDNGDGTVTVAFQRYDHDARTYVAEHVTVTRDVYGFGSSPSYGKSLKGEAWFPLLEKAYAQWKGGYDGIRSGYPFEAFEALLGAEGKHFDLDVSSSDAVWAAMQRQSRNGEAMVAWSRVDTRALSFSNTGLVGDHAYAIVGVELRDGERIVRLRNPWDSNPWSAANGPLQLKQLDGGILEMKLDVFMKYYAGYGSAPT